MGKLTTHVLDTAQGKPAAGLKIELFSLTGQRSLVKSVLTNDDGRCDAPLLDDSDRIEGEWELLFYVAEYFQGQDVDMGDPPFLNQVPVRFGMNGKEQHYHVPLLVSPWSYTTYRGS